MSVKISSRGVKIHCDDAAVAKLRRAAKTHSLPMLEQVIEAYVKIVEIRQEFERWEKAKKARRVMP